MSDLRQFAPATERNRSFILSLLQRVLPDHGTVLEISSGTGEHAVFFAPHLQPRSWIPSDPDPVALASIRAWRDHSPSPNLWPPIVLDVREFQWPIEQSPLPEPLTGWQGPLNAIVNINMIHIAPWECCQALMAGAGRCLGQNGVLYLYGPFKRGGVHTAPSNEAFDQSLRARNPQWGVRNLEDVETIAADQGFCLTHIEEMPANNLSLVFVKGASTVLS